MSVIAPTVPLVVRNESKTNDSTYDSGDDLLSGSSSSDEETFEDASENVLADDSGHSSHLASSPDASSSSSSSSGSDDELQHILCGEQSEKLSTGSAEDEETPPTLEEAIAEIAHFMDLIFENKFEDAYVGTEKWANVSLYHALGKGCLSFLKGCLTMESALIQKALADLKHCLDMCQREKRYSMTRMVWRPNYNTYTDVEIHAELLWAEAMLMTSLITFFEDQNLINLVRGAFRIRACFQAYKECYYILNNRTEWESENSRIHFESGVRLGIGTFNLILSHIPTKVMKLLEFVGFSGNRAKGLTELTASTQLRQGLRNPLAILIMLAYQCYIEHIFGLGEGDMKCATELLDYGLGKHPEAAFYLLFLGRLGQLTGKFDEAIVAYERCIKAQDEWIQFHHLCFWELLWCYGVQCDWEKAAYYANILRTECRWSPGAYTYQYATYLYMIMVEQNKPELREEIGQLLKKVPSLRNRIAGKTIPAEKFAIIQSEKYFRENGRLLMPSIEFMYIWNIFTVIGRAPHLLAPILSRVEKLIEKDNENQDGDRPMDEYCQCLLIKGMCLRYMQQIDESNRCFLEVIENKKRIETDDYLVPHATLELGLNYYEIKEFAEARQWMEKAREYSSYPLEAIVHFRIHTAIREMNKAIKRMRKQSDGAGGGEDSKQPGHFRSIWSSLSRRLTFGEKIEEESEELNEEEVEEEEGVNCFEQVEERI